MKTIVLLSISNIFMTIAWHGGHLNHFQHIFGCLSWKKAWSGITSPDFWWLLWRRSLSLRNG